VVGNDGVLAAGVAGSASAAKAGAATRRAAEAAATLTALPWADIFMEAACGKRGIRQACGTATVLIQVLKQTEAPEVASAHVGSCRCSCKALDQRATHAGAEGHGGGAGEGGGGADKGEGNSGLGEHSAEDEIRSATEIVLSTSTGLCHF